MSEDHRLSNHRTNSLLLSDELSVRTEGESFLRGLVPYRPAGNRKISRSLVFEAARGTLPNRCHGHNETFPTCCPHAAELFRQPARCKIVPTLARSYFFANVHRTGSVGTKQLSQLVATDLLPVDGDLALASKVARVFFPTDVVPGVVVSSMIAV